VTKPCETGLLDEDKKADAQRLKPEQYSNSQQKQTTEEREKVGFWSWGEITGQKRKRKKAEGC